jgi:outer membrane protein assembly factor BamB
LSPGDQDRTLSDMVELFVTVLLILAAVDQNGGHASAWPGVWGPSRNGVAATPGTPARPTAFKELWRRKAQGGYSEVAARGDVVVTMEARDGRDYVVSLDAASGRERWGTPVGPTYRGHDGSHDGPIATPVIDGAEVFAVGPHGVLVALELATGRERWRHDLLKQFGAAAPIYGFGSSPLVDGPRVIVHTGGNDSRGLLAFDRATGRVLWHNDHGRRGGYASPALGTLAGVRQIVAAAGDRIFAVAPDDGRLLWTIAGPGDGEMVANPPQFLSPDQVLLTTWNDATLLRITHDGEKVSAAEVWRSPRFRGAYSPTILRDGHLYGFAGAFLLCADAATGDIKWRHRMYEGTLIGVGSHLFVLGRTSGDLHVVAASPSGFSEILRTTVLTPGATSMTGPSVAADRVYVRNAEEIVALKIEGR